MKKRHYLILIAGIFISCATSQHEPLNRGVVNPDNIPEEELATLYITEFLGVYKINNENVEWEWEIKWSGIQYQVVKIPQGINVLQVRFRALNAYTDSLIPISANFEGGKTYILTYKPNLANTMVSFYIHLYDEKIIGEEVTIGKERPRFDYYNISKKFYKYFITPAEKKKVKLKSSEYNLELKPGKIFKLTNKKIKIETEGTFEVIRDPKTGIEKIYLLDNSNNVLSSSNRDNAQIILLLLDYNEVGYFKKIVLFRFEKPSPLAGKEILFNIN